MPAVKFEIHCGISFQPVVSDMETGIFHVTSNRSIYPDQCMSCLTLLRCLPACLPPRLVSLTVTLSGCLSVDLPVCPWHLCLTVHLSTVWNSICVDCPSSPSPVCLHVPLPYLSGLQSSSACLTVYMCIRGFVWLNFGSIFVISGICNTVFLFFFHLYYGKLRFF